MDQGECYDPRYLAGVVLFNRGDYFEAHEAWEDLWTESSGDARKFVQGLIQAAVGLCHFINGNLRGAGKLYRTSRAYMEGLSSPFYGLDLDRFWKQMATCFHEVIQTPDPDKSITCNAELLPMLEIEPPPKSWPDPTPYMTHDD